MLIHISILIGNRTIAVVKGSEDYTTIAESFQDVFQEINEIQEVGFVKVGENQIPVELFLGGDYKVSTLQMLHLEVHEHGFDYRMSWSHII